MIAQRTSHWLTTGALALVVAACASRAGVQTTRLPDGTVKLNCEGGLPNCLALAEDVCKGNPYEVLRARDQRDRYGPEMGTGQVEVRSSEAIVRCGKRGQPPPPSAHLDEAPAFRLRRPDAPPVDPNAAPAAPAPTAAAPAPIAAAPLPRACVPGSTQACVGPAKCEGGQSCLPDGSAYGPCD